MNDQTQDTPRATGESAMSPLPTVEQLRKALAESETSETRKLIEALFDEATFVELGTYTQKSFSEYARTGNVNELEGVICGYGAVDGQLVYLFAQDRARLDGAMDETHAAKILSLYQLAMQNGAPVVGIFNSAGADIYEGVGALAAYGKIMKAVTSASGLIPQIAVVTGECIGISASVAALFDFMICAEGSSFYVRAPEFGGMNEANEPITALRAKDPLSTVYEARSLLSFLPANASEGIHPTVCADDLNRMLGDPDFGGDLHNILNAVMDNGVYKELHADTATGFLTAFGTIGGVRCGVCGNTFQDGSALLSGEEARKAAKWISFCDAFCIPLVTFVNTAGFTYCKKKEQTSFATSLASLGAAYAASVMPKITIILGKAIGGAYTLCGSKALGCDIVYALENAEIGALSAEAAVAFAWNDRITLTKSREELEAEWRRSLSSPVAAACKGEVDDIINVSEMRQRICSALLMLAAKGTSRRRHGVLPL